MDWDVSGLHCIALGTSSLDPPLVSGIITQNGFRHYSCCPPGFCCVPTQIVPVMQLYYVANCIH